MNNLKNKNIFINFEILRNNLSIKNILFFFGKRIIDLFTHMPIFFKQFEVTNIEHNLNRKGESNHNSDVHFFPKQLLAVGVLVVLIEGR